MIVVTPFIDKETHLRHNVGDVVQFTEEREAELLKLRLVEVEEKIEAEKKPKSAPKK